jgi:hypothetical protein
MASAKVVTKKTRKPKDTVAIQAKDQAGHHAVGLWNLHVLIVPDGRFWFAQGLEIDFAVQGDSVADAKKQFENGLEATIHHHIRIFGDIQKLLRVAPNEVWLDLWSTAKAQHKSYSQISFHDLTPFHKIEYAEVARAAAA